jgi:CheY-like chemotaxis protein
MVPRKVLLVEHDPTLRQAMRLMLDRLGFAVLEASRGGKALSLAEAHFPSLILIDLGLADMDGVDVVRELHRRPGTSRIPIVALVDDSLAGPRAEAVAKICAGTIPKPITTERMQRALGLALLLCRRDPVRRFPRYPVDVPAWLRMQAGTDEAGGAYIGGTVRVLGEGGLRVDLGDLLPRASLLDLRLPMPTGEVTIPGKVIYSLCCEDHKTGRPAYQHGVQFAQVDPETLLALRRLIKAPAAVR